MNRQILKNSQRSMALDMCRIIACVLICMEHLLGYAGFENYGGSLSNLESNPLITYTFSFLEFQTPLFLMTSGAVVLPMKTSSFQFLKRRFTRIGIPTFLWTLIYIIPMIHFNTPERINLLLTQAPFIPSINGGFWFLYALFGLYLLTPILSRWINACSKRELEFYLLFWVLISLFPYAFHFSGANVGITSPFYYFSGYVGFYLLGYYLRKYKTFNNLQSWAFLIALYLIVDGSMPWLERALGMTDVTGAMGTNFGNVLRCAAIFVTILYLFGDRKSNRFTETLSKLTFGVYLINEIMNLTIPRILDIPEDHHFLRLGVASSICIVGSFVIVYFLSYLPGSNYFVAYHHK